MDKDTILITTVLALLVFFRDWLKDRKEKRDKVKEQESKQKNSSIEFVNEIDRQVRHAENKIKFTYHAMRMYVMHFSNGISTDAGLSLTKITFKHEVLEGYYVEPISLHFQEVPIPEFFSSPITHVIREGEYYLSDIEKLVTTEPNHRLYHNWLNSYKVKSVLWLPIKKQGNKIVAVLVMHFPVANHLNEIDISKIKDMKTEIEKIYDKL